ncbi:hypothetical protein GCM10027073_09790 [Streptomyces chlorus]|uniref:Uncharacterized protein n=1 Tax=Streptomyces chlorus TaxID=887452 RepID=A0ABW1DU11_9ACTN
MTRSPPTGRSGRRRRRRRWRTGRWPRAREARADLLSAQSRLSSAESWVGRASKEADQYKDDPTGSKSDADKPDEAKVRAATRDARNAESAETSARSDVSDAQDALAAAKKMAADARTMREEAARDAKSKIDEASDAGMQNRSVWGEIGDWFTDNWDTIVAVRKVVVAVVGIVAMIIGGPILGAIVLIAALVVLADTLYKYSKGQASLWDVGLAVEYRDGSAAAHYRARVDVPSDQGGSEIVEPVLLGWAAGRAGWRPRLPWTRWDATRECPWDENSTIDEE